MVNFEASHWSKTPLVFFTTNLGVEGFVIYGLDLSNLGYSPYMTNLGDKSHMIIIRDVFYHSTVVNRAHIRQNPVTNSVQFDLSHLGGICHNWGHLFYLGVVCHIWVGFVICGGVCHIWVGFVKYGLLFNTVL